MAEYSRLARGRFVSTGQAQIVNLPFQPDRVRLINYTVANSAAASQNIAYAEWDAYMGQGFAVVQGYNATPALIFDTVTANGISTFSAGLALQFGPTLVVTVVSKAAAAQVTTSTAHGLKSGDKNDMNNYVECIRILVQAGADKNIPNVDGNTAFDLLNDEDVELKELLN